MSAGAALTHLRAMLNAIAESQSFAAGLTYDEFAVDVKTLMATERSLEVVGDAAKALPREVKALDATIPWERIVDTTKLLRQHYDEVQPRDVWRMVQVDLLGIAPRITELEEAVRSRGPADGGGRQTVDGARNAAGGRA